MAGGPYGDGVSVKTSWGKIHRTFLSGLLFLLGGCDRDGVPAAGRDGLSGNVADRVVPQRPGALVPPPADSDAWGAGARGLLPLWLLAMSSHRGLRGSRHARGVDHGP